MTVSEYPGLSFAELGVYDRTERLMERSVACESFLVTFIFQMVDGSSAPGFACHVSLDFQPMSPLRAACVVKTYFFFFLHFTKLPFLPFSDVSKTYDIVREMMTLIPLALFILEKDFCFTRFIYLYLQCSLFRNRKVF